MRPTRALEKFTLSYSGGEDKVISFAFCLLTLVHQRYCVTRKELLAVVRFTRQFHHYLLGSNFILRTDHSSLTWLYRFKRPEGQLARWLEELRQYNFVIEHRPGSHHANADALSRKNLDKEPCVLGPFPESRRKEYSPKLQAPWQGPLVVTACLGPVFYKVRDRRSEKVLHHDRL